MPSDPWSESESDPLRAILDCRDPHELEQLVSSAPTPALRGLARLALDTLASDEQPGDPLLTGLASPDAAVRLACAKTLPVSGQPSHLPILQRRFIAEEAAAVRVLLLEAIGSIGGAGRWPFIASALRDPERAVRLRVLDLAARLAPRQELIATVLQGLKDPDGDVRQKAMGLLMVAGAKGEGEPRPREETGLDESEKLSLARRLRTHKDPDMLPVVRQLLEPLEPPAVRAEALVTLAALGDRAELERVERMAREPEPRPVRAAALLYLLSAGVEAVGDATLLEHARSNLARLQASQEPLPFAATGPRDALELALPATVGAAILALSLWMLLY